MLRVLPRLVTILIVGSIILFFSVTAASAFTLTIPTIAIPTITIRRLTPGTSQSPASPTPTAKPSATPTIKPSATPTPEALGSVSADPKKDFMMKVINEYRRSLGLSSVQTSQETCDFAKIRAKEISTDFNHDGFQNRINSHTIPYSGWSMITENIAMTSSYKNVVNMWINSPGHAENMRRNTPYVCVEAYGNYYAYEGMKP